jgi:two-component system sensor histidine kinase EvgS
VQEDQRAQPELFRLIAEYTYDWETWVDATGTARWLNSAVERITGFDVESCLNDSQYPLSLVHEEDRAVVEGALREAAAGKSGNDVEFRVRAKWGDAVWVAMSWQPVRGPLGENLGYRTSVRDIDARKRMEEELHAMRRRAERALRARSTLLANVSHELRSPVHCIAGFTELLQQTRLDAEQHRYLALIDDQCQSMLHQVEDLLGLAALEADGVRLKTAPFDVVMLVERLVEAEDLRVKRRPVALRVSTTLASPYRLGDALRIRQVVRNLLDNALKFTDAGCVHARLYSGDAEDVVIEVEDTGPGIAPEDIARVFEPFVQADDATTRRHGGVGLGLSIAQRLVRSMHGELTVHSQLGSGTRICARLPLPVAERTSIEPPAMPEPEPELVPARVLVVDDSAPARELLAAMLRRFGAHALCASSGTEAKRIASSARVDLVLLDYQMPDTDGAETAVALRRIFKARSESIAIPIYLLTANAFVRDELGTQSAAFDGILEKPLRQADLLRTLRKVPRPVDVEARDSAVLDLRVLEDLANLSDRDGRPLLQRFGPKVLGELAQGLTALQRHVDADAPELSKVAHSMAGSAASIGARSLAEALRALELAEKCEGETRAQIALERVQALWEPTCAALRQHGVVLPEH